MPTGWGATILCWRLPVTDADICEWCGTPPGGKPIPGVTNEDDVTWALDKARRFIFRGGDKSDPSYRAYLDRWLDYLNDLRRRSS